MVSNGRSVCIIRRKLSRCYCNLLKKKGIAEENVEVDEWTNV